MKPTLFSVLVYCLVSICSLAFCDAIDAELEPPSVDFTAQLAITKQDREMDWWKSIPSRFPPQITDAGTIVRGQTVEVFPTFFGYGVDSKGNAEVKWHLKVTNPEGKVTINQGDLTGLMGETEANWVLPSLDCIHFYFNEDGDDALGEYTFEVFAEDAIRQQNSKLTGKVRLVDFEYEPEEKDFGKWFFQYPSNPRPEAALWHFTQMDRPLIDKKKGPVLSALWLFKTIFENNNFLVSQAIHFYESEANSKQKKDLIYLFLLLGKLELLPVENQFHDYCESLNRYQIPDPYAEIFSGYQLDMLWAEYFATSRIKPLEHFMTVFENGKYFGTRKKVEAGELNKKDPVVRQQLIAEAVLNSGVWSLKSNLFQSELLLQNCIYILESKMLPQTQGPYLQAIVNQTIETKRAGK